jgi:hypothetical protein
MLNMNYICKRYISTKFDYTDDYENIIIKRSVALAMQLNQLLYGVNQNQLFTEIHVLDYINNFMQYVHNDYKFKPSIIKIQKEMNKAKLIDFTIIDNEEVKEYFPLTKSNSFEYNTKILKAGYVKKIIENEKILRNSNEYSKEVIILALRRNEISLKEYTRFIYKHKNDVIKSENNDLMPVFNFNLDILKPNKKLTPIKDYIEKNKQNGIICINRLEILNVAKEIKRFNLTAKRMNIKVVIKDN